MKFHVAEIVPDRSLDDPTPELVLLVHGFADLWCSWRSQLVALGDAGYHAAAVDLRGYGDSDKPPRGYDGWTLAGDIAGLIRSLGHTEAHIVGHADGGLVCWATAALHPRSVRSIALLASPHPLALRRAAIRDRAQRRALLPTFLRYQLPRIPERALTANDGAEVERLVRERSSTRWQRSPEFADTVDVMRHAIAVPGVAHSTLEYQRWAFRSQFRSDGRRFASVVDTVLDVPAVQILGGDDPYVLARTARHDADWAPGIEVHELPGVGHYVHHEEPERVTALLLETLRRS